MAEITQEAKSHELTVYLPDTRGVTLSRYGRGNLKLGMGVYSYSRLPGRTYKAALGTVDARPTGYFIPDDLDHGLKPSWPGTCPGSTPECERICFASRPVAELGPVASMWLGNSIREDVPPIPADAKLLRLHVSGDFTSIEYISNWITNLSNRPDVTTWVYTRSWRVPELLPHLENLRALPNVQMFASIDKSTPDDELKMITAAGWRRAWIDGDPRAGKVHRILAHTDKAQMFKNFEVQETGDSVKTLICPEETKAVKNCEECGFCFAGPRNDVTILEH